MTRSEYRAALEAEYPGAYGRIDDLMRSWDRENQSAPAADPAPNEDPEI